MKIAIIGYGKMGKAIESCLAPSDEIVLKVTASNAHLLQSDALKEADVAIEFSRPEAAVSNILSCIHAHMPVVSGTTGWLDDLPVIEEAINKHDGSMVYASNFSVGVNLLFAANTWLAKKMAAYSEYSVDIHEVHHTEKLDAPSGTAITLAEQIINQTPYLNSWVKDTKTQLQELPISSARMTGVNGFHQVTYSSSIDQIQLSHEAHSREGFAKGAILAAHWILGRKGMFNMQDVLGL